MKLLSVTALAAPCLAFVACTALVDLGGPNAGVVDGGGGGDGAVTPDAGGAGDAGEGGVSCDPRTADCDCTGAKPRWAQMVLDPMIPPYRYAGLDHRGRPGDQWAGLTLEDAEKINCKAVLLEPSGGAGSGYWGNNEEVAFAYDLDTHLIRQIVQGPGDHAVMGFKDRSGANTYTIQIGGGITKNGAAFLIDWLTPAAREAQLTELFNALMGPNGPGAVVATHPFVDSANCKLDRNCLIIPDDGTGVAYFGTRPLAFYLNFHSTGQPQPTASIPFQSYTFFSKTLPYSAASVTMKIDATGPLLDASFVASPTGVCALRLGTTFNDLVRNCVKVSGTMGGDDLNINKLFGGRTYDLETIVSNVDGVNPVMAKTLRGLDVVAGQDYPGDSDPVVGFSLSPPRTVEPRPRRYANDLDAAGARDLHGTGLVFREWARLVQADLSAGLPPSQRHTLGAAECLGATPAVGCTGFEAIELPGIVFAGDPPEIQKLVGPQPTSGVDLSIFPSLGITNFCSDPGTFANCENGDGTLWGSALARVTKVLGRGTLASLPSEAQDRRYYFRWFALAQLKYLKAYGASPTLLPAGVASASVDLEAVTFGRDGHDVFDKTSYVERAFMTASNPTPLTLDYIEQIETGATRYVNWRHHVERAEAALFTAMLTDKANLPGAENNVNVTNLFGSPVLAAAYESAYCATTIDAALCTRSQPPPQDAPGVLTRDLNGAKPLLAYYPGAFGQTVLTRGRSPIKLISTDPGGPPAGKAAVAILEIPNARDPYTAPGGANPSTPIQTVVPWTAAGGFSIPTGAATDKQVSASQVTFEGAFGKYVVDYAMYLDPGTHQPTGEIVVQAIESSSFPGEVFLCRDTATGDLLRARSYTSAKTMLDWIAAHPQATTACDLVVRMRPANAGVDFIASRKNGVKVSMSQGDGAGRVLRALAYDPAL